MNEREELIKQYVELASELLPINVEKTEQAMLEGYFTSSDEELKKQIADLQKQVERKREHEKTKAVLEKLAKVKMVDESLMLKRSGDVSDAMVTSVLPTLGGIEEMINDNGILKESLIKHPDDIALTDEQVVMLRKKLRETPIVDKKVIEGMISPKNAITLEEIAIRERQSLQNAVESMSSKERSKLIKEAKRQARKAEDEKVFDDVIKALEELNAKEAENKKTGPKRKK